MALPNLYSRRLRESQKTDADVYHYVELSPKLRQQIILIIRRYASKITSHEFYEALTDRLREEVATERLAQKYTRDEEFDHWFRACDDLNQTLDAVELSAKILLVLYRERRQVEKGAEFAAEVNARILESGAGFQLENYQIVRMDSKYLHQDVVVPALNLLSGSAFQTANEEFRKAHKEYVDGNYDDSIHDCCNALESVLKIICTQKKWVFNPNDPAKKLLTVVFDNGLIPTYMQTEFTGLRTILESGVPTVRNKEGGHGTGANPRNIPSYIASFQLHQTAAAIVLLVEAAR